MTVLLEEQIALVERELGVLKSYRSLSHHTQIYEAILMSLCHLQECANTREPTPEMIEAGAAVLRGCEWPDEADIVRAVWLAMEGKR